MALALIGRNRKLIDDLAIALRRSAAGEGHHTRWITEDRRGSHFDVRVVAPDGATNYVARVSVELLPPEQCRAELGADWIGPEPLRSEAPDGNAP